MRIELIAGQYLDVLEQAWRRLGGPGAAGGPVQDRQLHRAAAAAVRRGAGRCGDGRCWPRTRVRAAVGEAFQLRDDLLGVFGDPAETGKPAGDDLRDGKPTVLVALARQSSSAAQARLLERHLGDPGLDRGRSGRAAEVIVATGALAGVERMIRAGTEQALAALAPRRSTRAREVALHELATAATVRRL